ncbi:MAG: arylsulfatase [Planctomycetes bacterium]|nr:arylsulfatase [Planctomycetota bacterium]
MKSRTYFLLILLSTVAASVLADKPNIVVMLADDMGFGEVQHFNPKRGKIKTPHLDRLAQSGMVFTDAHSGSSVCSPTRYGLMTGRYAWRTRLQRGVLTGGESLIAQDRLTLAKMLRKQGYHTAVIGKWHLGMFYDGVKNAGKVQVGAKITHGPIDRGGFDEFHGFHHARQMDVWIENDVVAHRIDAVEMLPKLTSKAVEYIHSRKDKGQPFFLYVPWNSPHSPVVPTKKWQGKSGLNSHADFVMQTDDSFGQVLQALKDTDQFTNTLVICSSDNGTSGPTSKMSQLIKLGHHPSGDLRGSKADIWDGGHRVPFIASWPGVIKPGRRSSTLVCLTDIFATAAEITGHKLPPTEGVDSMSFAQDLHGKADLFRTSVIHHSIEGQFAIREHNWKLICCPGSGGWSKPGTKTALKQAQMNGQPSIQLYDMEQDLGEQKNLAAEMPAKVKALRKMLDEDIKLGRSTSGPRQKNDVAIVVDKWKAKSDKNNKKKAK